MKLAECLSPAGPGQGRAGDLGRLKGQKAPTFSSSAGHLKFLAAFRGIVQKQVLDYQYDKS